MIAVKTQLKIQFCRDWNPDLCDTGCSAPTSWVSKPTGSWEIFPSSIRNCVSCVFNCDDRPYIYLFIDLFHFSLQTCLQIPHQRFLSLNIEWIEWRYLFFGSFSCWMVEALTLNIPFQGYTHSGQHIHNTYHIPPCFTTENVLSFW